MSDQHTNAHGEEAPNSDVHHLKGQATSSTLRPSNSNSSEKASTPPFSNWFLDKNKTMNAARGNYIKIYFGGSFFIVLAIFSMFSIFWGALWRAPTRHLPGWVVDFDGGNVGQTVAQALVAGSPASRISWTVRPASDFPGGPGNLANSVFEEHVWAGLAIHEGASSRLQAALNTPNSSYNSADIMTAYAVEARNENAFRSILRPSIQGHLDILSQQFALTLARSQANNTGLAGILAASPQTLISPIGYRITNLAPFDIPVATAVTFVGLIYLLILSFFLVMIGMAAREASGLERLLSLPSLILVRLGSAFVGYFFLSLFYSLLSLAFQLPFDRRFGNAGFLVFWMLNFIGMLSVGLALESMITLLTARFIPFFMILWIISNVSVCFLPIEVLPGIYKYGYAAPFYNVSRAVRTIVFATKSELGLDFGILIVWVTISCISLPLIQWYVRRRVVRDAAAGTGANTVSHGHGNGGIGGGQSEESIEDAERRDAEMVGKAN